MKSGLLQLLCLLFILIGPQLAIAQTNISTLSQSGLGFGASVAIDNETIYVSSAPVGWPRGAEPASSVHVYKKDGEGKWLERSILTASDGTTGDNFGRSLYVDDSLLVVGAPGLGAAYLFERNEQGDWYETDKLIPSALQEEALFGGANNYAGYRSKTIAKAGDRIAITSYSTKLSNGSVHIFKKDNERGWTEESILKPEDFDVPTDFAWSVAATGNFIFIGAWRTNNEQGAIHAFQLNADTQQWEKAPIVVPASVKTKSAFGYSLAAYDNTLFVGAPGFGGAGSLFMYELNTSLDRWMLSGQLSSSNQQRSARGFGGSIDAYAHTLIVGGRQGGNAHIFEFDSDLNTWTSQHTLTPANSRTAMGFGLGVAIGADVSVVGSPRADFEEGVATVYEFMDRSWKATSTLASEVALMTSVQGNKIECTEGMADSFDCSEVDLLSFISIKDLSTERGVKMTDLWGWTDPVTEVEYVLQARTEAFLS